MENDFLREKSRKNVHLHGKKYEKNKEKWAKNVALSFAM